MENKMSVTRSNALIQSGYRLSLTEMQIVLYGIGLINPLKKDFPLSYRIDIDRFAQMFNKKRGSIYQEVKDAVVKKFWERDFSYTNDKGKTVTLRWLTKMVYEDNSGYLEIKFNEDVQPYLHQLQGNFTKYYIDEITQFKSIYSFRFYEYAIMFLNEHKINKGKFVLAISEIKKMLDISDKYERFCDFKPYVLEPANREINKFSNLNFSYRVIKLGRVSHEIEFTITRKQKIENGVNKPQNTRISTTFMEKANKIVIKAGTGWDTYAIEKQFYEYMKKVGQPDNLDAAFLGFVKKKVVNKP